MSVTYRVEVFDAGGSNPRLRWFTPEGGMQERRLHRQDVEALLKNVEPGAAADLRAGGVGRDTASVSAPVAGAADLSVLGGRLYRWLDGPTERWLAAGREQGLPMLLQVDAEERLRGLPWELLFDEAFLAVDLARPVTPVRIASPRNAGARAVANRALRVLFMASSPLEVEPVLDFEAEEAKILEAAAGKVEVVVEESGSLPGLRSMLAYFGAGYFDVLHLNGHGYIDPDGPRFVMEAEDGSRADASARDIAAALEGDWPGLVFVSGCYTGGAAQEGLVASMAEALVDAGAPLVLGWGLPVGDAAAIGLAAALYQKLAEGKATTEAVRLARRAMHGEGSAYWPLLRLYADRSPVTALVTPLGTKGRSKPVTRASSALFLDAEGKVKVADRASFVGRRRELQALLRQMRPEDPTTGPQVALVHGMGGLGKSTLTARLLDRLQTTHPQRAVWVGKVDADSIRTLTDKLTLDDPDVDQKVQQLLGRDTMSLADRVRYILTGPLEDIGCVFVFDDFEDGNLEETGTGRHHCTSEALDVLRAFGDAIRRSGSQSRVLVTSRYDFPLPPELDVARLSISQLQGADLVKKVRLMANLGPTSTYDPAVRARAVEAAAGIPRLIEAMDSLVGVVAGDLGATLEAIESTRAEYREKLVLGKLLAAQTHEVRWAIALAAVFEIAVPVEAILAISPNRPIRDELDAAVGSGLVQSGYHPGTGELRYLVSPLVRDLLAGQHDRIEDAALIEAQRRGAQFLFERWAGADG